MSRRQVLLYHLQQFSTKAKIFWIKMLLLSLDVEFGFSKRIDGVQKIWLHLNEFKTSMNLIMNDYIFNFLLISPSDLSNLLDAILTLSSKRSRACSFTLSMLHAVFYQLPYLLSRFHVHMDVEWKNNNSLLWVRGYESSKTFFSSKRT